MAATRPRARAFRPRNDTFPATLTASRCKGGRGEVWYGERGLAGERAAVWLYGENLTIEYADEPLSRYKVTYQPDNNHPRAIAESQLYDNPHRSPQPPLWELGDGGWLKVLRLPEYRPRRKPAHAHAQSELFA